MRDPSIVRGPDGLYHMVWTVNWNEPGIGYAHSEDLIYWSEQEYLSVMEHEPDVRNAWAPEFFYDEATEQGRIALQAEGSEVEFRKVLLTRIERLTPR